jgi:hypothetical protein
MLCRLTFSALYADDFCFKSDSMLPTCFAMMSDKLFNDDLMGYFAMSHQVIIKKFV